MCSPGIVSKFRGNVLRVSHVKEKKFPLYRIIHVSSSQGKAEESEVVLVPMP